MSARPGAVGATRICPHCKSTILESSSVCPSCRHHLKFDADASKRASPANTALRVEGTIRQPADAHALEYSMVLTIKNERGEEIDRKLVGVGAMKPNEQRTFALSVEIFGAGIGTAAASSGTSRRH